MLDVIATVFVKSRVSLAGAVTAWIDSLFVRTTSPSLADSRGSAPECLQSASSLFVPSAPAAITTPRVVNVRGRLRSHAPGCSVVTS